MKQEFKQIAQAYFRGTIEAADEVRLSAWLRESDANHTLFRQWEDEWRQVARSQASAKTQAAWEKMMQATSSKEQKLHILKEQKPHLLQEQKAQPQIIQPAGVKRIPQTNRRTYYAAAAVALLLIVTGMVWLLQPAAQEPFMAQTGAHEMQQLTLPDGTKVTLNSLSSLACAGDFNNAERQIFFEGEAVFDVAKDAERPFVIHVGDYSVTVLGTQFNLSAYPSDESYTIALIEGKVCVAYQADTVYMQPNEQVRFDVPSQTFNKQPYNASQAASWTLNRLEGEFALGELAHKLERIYDVQIAFAEPDLAQEEVYISVGFEEPFNDVCGALQTLLPLHIDQTDNHYLISAR